MAFSAKMHSGKTTLADRLVAEHGYVRASFAAPLKALAERLGLPMTREVLQNLGHGARELIGPNVWVDAFDHNTKDLKRIVVDDMRYENEYAYLLGRNATMVRLDASIQTRWARFKTSDKFDPTLGFEKWAEHQSHTTETALDKGFHWDVFIGTDALTSEQVYEQLLAHAPHIR